MTWHDFLRVERRRKLKATSLVMSGHIRTTMMKNGVQIDTTEQTIATTVAEIAEIDMILEAAARALECDDDEQRFKERLGKLVKPKGEDQSPSEGKKGL